MADKQLSKLKITPNDEDTYIIYDNEARTLVQSAQSTADSKLKTASLSSSYDSVSKTLTISLLTTTN